jgi:uncharacterized membrane protein
MSHLAVIGFDDQFKADEVRVEVLRLQRECALDLEDAAVAVKKPDGTVSLHQTYNLAKAGAVGGGFWGLLIGTLFLSPILGIVAGASAGAVAGALADVGIEDDFMQNVAATLRPGTSALFILVRTAPPEILLQTMHTAGGKVLQTSLGHVDEARLRSALGEQQARRAS